MSKPGSVLTGLCWIELSDKMIKREEGPAVRERVIVVGKGKKAIGYIYYHGGAGQWAFSIIDIFSEDRRVMCECCFTARTLDIILWVAKNGDSFAGILPQFTRGHRFTFGALAEAWDDVTPEDVASLHIENEPGTDTGDDR